MLPSGLVPFPPAMSGFGDGLLVGFDVALGTGDFKDLKLNLR